MEEMGGHEEGKKRRTKHARGLYYYDVCGAQVTKGELMIITVCTVISSATTAGTLKQLLGKHVSLPFYNLINMHFNIKREIKI